MTLNLIQIGAIVPQQLSITGVVGQIATIFNITTSRILELQYWPHQLWMNISGVGGRIFSYRRLPAWLNQAIIAIKNCNTLEQLQELGAILKNERENFPDYYTSENLEKLRQVWSQKRQDLQLREEQLKPLKEHQQAAQRWLASWQEILNRWDNLESFQVLVTEIDSQSQEFADLPEIIREIRHICQQKQRELESRV